MCSEDSHKYAACGCTCIYRSPCPAQRMSPNELCVRVFYPLEPKPKPGYCNPCRIVIESQKRLRAIPGNELDGGELRREREYFAGTTWVEILEGDATEPPAEVRPSEELARKKSWSDGVRWNARQSMETLKKNIGAWKREKREMAEREKEDIVPLMRGARDSRDSSRKSDKTEKSRRSGRAGRASRSTQAAESVGVAGGTGAAKPETSWWDTVAVWFSKRNRRGWCV